MSRKTKLKVWPVKQEAEESMQASKGVKNGGDGTHGSEDKALKIKEEPKDEPKEEPEIKLKEELKVDLKEELKVEVKEEVKDEPRQEPKVEPKEEPKYESMEESIEDDYDYDVNGRMTEANADIEAGTWNTWMEGNGNENAKSSNCDGGVGKNLMKRKKRRSERKARKVKKEAGEVLKSTVGTLGPSILGRILFVSAASGLSVDKLKQIFTTCVEAVIPPQCVNKGGTFGFVKFPNVALAEAELYAAKGLKIDGNPATVNFVKKEKRRIRRKRKAETEERGGGGIAAAKVTKTTEQSEEEDRKRRR